MSRVSAVVRAEWHVEPAIERLANARAVGEEEIHISAEVGHAALDIVLRVDLRLRAERAIEGGAGSRCRLPARRLRRSRRRPQRRRRIGRCQVTRTQPEPTQERSYVGACAAPRPAWRRLLPLSPPAPPPSPGCRESRSLLARVELHHRRAASVDRAVGVNRRAMEAASHGAEHPCEMLEAHIGAGFARIVRDQRLHGRGIALDHQVEHPPVPRILTSACDAIVGRIDLVAKRGARQAADTDHGDPAAQPHRLVRRHLPELQGLFPIVIEVVRRHHDRAGAVSVEEAIGDDAARIYREAVVIDAPRLDPERAAAADAGLRKLGVGLHVVV